MNEIPILIDATSCELLAECASTETTSELGPGDNSVDELSIFSADATMPIAVVGMGFRGPGDATNVPKLWEMIIEGREGWKPIPESRWNNAAFYHPDHGRHGTINVQGGHFIDEDISLFDAPFFNMTSDEAAAMDPQQRLLLEVTYEGLENGGISLTQVMGSKTSCFVGSFCADYTDMLLRDPECVPMYQCTNAGQSRAMVANRVSYFFDLKGPSVTVDTACSGSLVALHLACQSIRTGDASMAIAAGVNLILSHEFMSTMSMMRFLSPDGRCYTFDEKANGYARGEAVGCLILKPLADALRDQNTIRAVIRGTGSNQDGRTPGITLPSGTAQETLIRDVYARAGLCPSETEVVEAHGTGTQAGDPVETGAISRVFGVGHSPDKPVRIGSIKTNVGHLEGASGIASVIKAVLMLENRLILPTRNFDTPNPRVPLEEWRLKVQLLPEPWESPGPHRVSVNSFGYGGSNAHVILEDTAGYLHSRGLQSSYRRPNGFRKELSKPNGISKITTPRHRVFIISGFDELSCAAQVKSLREYLLTKGEEEIDDNFMADLAFTLNECRSRFMWKVAVTGSSLTDVISSLSNNINPRSSILRPALAYVFTGQGAQWSGMGKGLFHTYPAFQESISKMDQILLELGASFQIYDEISKTNNSQLSHPTISQTVCSALQIAIVDLLASWDLYPDSVTGHSSGEIAAAYAGGALSMKDAIMVAYYRGVAASNLLSTHNVRGAMMAIGASPDEVQSLLMSISSGRTAVACINSPSSVTVSGDEAAIDDLAQQLRDKPIFSRRLAVDVAYHSHHMELVAEEYLRSIETIRPCENRLATISPTFFSSVTGTELQLEELGSQYWVDNLLGQVKFGDSLKTLCFETNSQRYGMIHSARRHAKRAGAARKASVDCILEIGPHAALSGPVKQILQADAKLKTADIVYASVLSRNTDAVSSTLNAISTLASLNYPLNLQAVNISEDAEKERLPRLVVDMPPYSWNHTRSYWAEPRLSSAFRNREYPRTEILGAPDNIGCPFEPRWRNHLRVSEIPWLADHKIQSDIVFPAAGYLSMAIEAIMQLVKDSTPIAGVVLHRVSIKSALIIPEAGDIETMTSLQPFEGNGFESELIHKFHIYSVSKDNRWVEHCTGIVGVEKFVGDADEISIPELDSLGLMLSEDKTHDISIVDVNQLYERLHRVGLDYGDSFANLTSAHATQTGLCFAEVTIPNIEAAMPMNFENPLSIHPCTLDSMFHSIFAALPKTMPLEKGPFIPVSVERMSLSCQNIPSTGHILAVCTSIRPGLQGEILASILAAGAGGEVSQQLKPQISIDGMRCARLEVMSNDTDRQKETPIAYGIDWRLDPDFTSLNNALNSCKNQPNGHAKGLKPREFHDCYAAFLISNIVSALNENEKKLDLIHQKYLSELGSIIQEYGNPDPALDIESELDTDQTTLSQPMAQLLQALRDCLLTIFEDRIQDFLESRDRLWSAYWEVISEDGTYKTAADYLDLVCHKKPSISILQIGDGTGQSCPIFQEHLLRDLTNDDKANLRFGKFVFAYQTESEIEHAQLRLTPLSEWVSYAKLDMERDLPEQGFEEHSYDMIIIPHGLQSAKSLQATLSKFHSLLNPSGYLLIIDPVSSRPGPLNAVLATVFYKWHPTGSGKPSETRMGLLEWDQALSRCGFTTKNLAKSSDNQHTLERNTFIIARPEADLRLPDSKILIIREEVCDQGLTKCLHNLLQETSCEVTMSNIAHADPRDKICVVFSDVQTNMLIEPDDLKLEKVKEIVLKSAGALWITQGGTMGSTNPESALVVGFARTARSESGVRQIITLDLDGKNPLPEIQAAEIVFKLMKNRLLAKESEHEDTEYAERNGQILIPRVVERTDINRDLAQLNEFEIETEQYFRERDQPICLSRTATSTTGNVQACFTADSQLTELPEGYVGIEVLAFGLSEGEFNRTLDEQLVDTPVGTECSGRVYAIGPGVDSISVGDRVACLGNSTFRSFYHDSASAFQKLDNNMSYELAASLPLAYSVAYYITYYMARIESNHTVLIDDAASWCEQAILETFCLEDVGVLAVVSTPSQKETLSNRFGLSQHQILVIGETNLVKDVLRATNGKGADLVLTSSAASSKNFQMLSKCVSPFGQLVQLRNADDQPTREYNMAWNQSNISFSTFNIFQLLRDKPDLARYLWSQVMCLFREDRLRGPSIFTVHKVTELEEALRNLSSEKHITLSAISNEMVHVKLPNTSNDLFKRDATYLLVGGLGGIGRAIALWMVDHGAEHLILVNRSGLSTDTARSTVQELRNKGCQVFVYACDVSDEAQVQQMVQDMSQTAPPIRGLIHGAMVLKVCVPTSQKLAVAAFTEKHQDVHIEKMTADDYNSVLRPRHSGTWNLHRALPADLDFFVMLSSISGVIGNATQAAYAAGSAFMDSFAAYRNALDLPAVSLDLGTITDVGYLAENKDLAAKMEKQGFQGTDTPTLLSLVQLAITQPQTASRAQIVTGLGEYKAGESLANFDAPLFSHFRRRFRGQEQLGRADDTAEVLRDGLRASKTHDEAASIILDALSGKLASQLGIPIERIEPSSPLSDFGVDSHVAVELRNWISKTMESTVPILEILASDSVLHLAGHIASRSSLLTF